MKLKSFFLTLLSAVALMGSACSDDKTTPEEPKPPVMEEPTIRLEIAEVGEESVTLNVMTANATRAALLSLPAEEEQPDNATIFGFGKEITPTEEAQQVTLENLLPEREYRIYALAADNEGVYGELQTVEFTTQVSTKMLRRGETTKRGFSYEVVLPEEQTGAHYLHTYFPAETFDYQLRQSQMSDGEEFDYDIFVKNILASYGFMDQGSKTISWSAGDPNEYYTPYVATIVGGKRYYAMMALINEEGTDFLSEASVVDLTTLPAGESPEELNVMFEEVSTFHIRARMECPENVIFYFYNLVTKASWDEKKASVGLDGMKDYLYEYGWSAANTYTDAWSVNYGTEYMLGIMGVDLNGDTFLMEAPVSSENVTPQIDITLKPYERDLLGLHAYDTFYVDVVPYYFDSMDVPMWAIFDERERVDEAMKAAGTTLEEFAANPTMELIEKLGSFIESLPEEEHDMLVENGYLTGLYDNFEPDTEYCYLLVIPNRNELYCGYKTARTEAKYGGGEPSEAYSAFLGEWTVLGQTTEDYYTRKSYTLRIEPLTVNRSYKIYGWSMGGISQEYPFEARFLPEKNRIAIEGAQMLGVKEIEGEEHIIVLNGYFSYSGELGMLGGYDGTFYEARCDGSHLSLFPQLFYYGGTTYEFKTIGYTSLINGNYFTIEGEEYNLVNFTIDRPTNTSSQPVVENYVLQRGPSARVHSLKPASTGMERVHTLPTPLRSFKR
uniref:hypothetical protein n=1 Tax=Alistipes sp. TaxID=1872444 RepID=UPI004056DE2E